MDDDLQTLGEEVVTTIARLLRWAPKPDEILISLAAARLLARLQDSGPVRISDLAAAERSSQPTITNHVKRLEALGLIERTVDEGDRRASIIGLTPAGRKELGNLRRSLGASMEPHLAQLSRHDLIAIREGIAALQRLMTQTEPVLDR